MGGLRKRQPTIRALRAGTERSEGLRYQMLHICRYLVMYTLYTFSKLLVCPSDTKMNVLNLTKDVHLE